MNKIINELFGFNFSNFGVGAFYRYGPYKLTKNSDNLTYKMTVSFSF